MKLINNIKARLMALWALITFVITFFLIFIPSILCWLLPDPGGQKLFIRIARIWMTAWLRITGCSIKVTGQEHFIPGQAFIIACNHNSMLDVPLSCPFIPGPNKTIAKSTFAYIPLFGLYYMKGSVLVNRKSTESRRKSYTRMKAVLKKGMHMSVFPEGTRNRTNAALKKFHDGAFRLATESGHPIIPAILFNTKEALPPHKKFWFRPQPLSIHFLAPVYPGLKTTELLKEEVFEIMQTYYAKQQPLEVRK